MNEDVEQYSSFFERLATDTQELMLQQSELEESSL